MAAFNNIDFTPITCDFGRSGYNVPSGSGGSGNGGENGGDKK